MVRRLTSRVFLCTTAFAAAVCLAHAQTPAPAPDKPTPERPAPDKPVQTPAPSPGAAPAADAPPVRDEAAEWKAAMDLKLANKGLQAHELFARFREHFPASKRVNEALVEMGVCWMIVARDKQVWHRNRPECAQHWRDAIAEFERVAKAQPDDPFAARAQYCIGLVHIQLGDLDAARAAFTAVIEKYPGDKLYRSKSIERRSAVARHRLDTAAAQPDIDTFLREVDKDAAEYKEAYALVQRFANYAKAMDKPAPALQPEVWASKDSTSLAALRGECVALYFFAPWCHNCLKEAEFIHEMSERWGPLGLHFVGVTDFSTAPQGSAAGTNPNDANETRTTIGTVQAYLAQHAFTFPVMMDRGATAQKYQARKYPEIVLVDREGRVRWHDHPSNLLDTTIERLLFGAPTDAAHGATPGVPVK